MRTPQDRAFKRGPGLLKAAASPDLSGRRELPDLKAQASRAVIRQGKNRVDIQLAMDGKVFSWAAAQSLPEEGHSRLFHRQPDPQRLGPGGVPATVSTKERRVYFTVSEGPHKGGYALLHQGGNAWLAIKQRDIKPGNEKNLTVVQVQDGEKKEASGVLVADRGGHILGKVAAGFTSAQRAEMWRNPASWLGRTVKVGLDGSVPTFRGFSSRMADTLIHDPGVENRAVRRVKVASPVLFVGSSQPLSQIPAGTVVYPDIRAARENRISKLGSDAPLYVYAVRGPTRNVSSLAGTIRKLAVNVRAHLIEAHPSQKRAAWSRKTPPPGATLLLASVQGLSEENPALPEDKGSGVSMKLAEVQGETLSVVLFMDPVKDWLADLQKKVVEKVPDVRELTPKDQFHVTLAYASGLDGEKIEAAVPKIRKVLEGESKPTLSMGPLEVLTNQKGEQVIYLAASSDEVSSLHWRLRKLIEASGGKFTFPNFRIHITLGFRDMALTGEELYALRHIASRKVAVPTRVEITTKAGDSWAKLDSVKLAALYASCESCGYATPEAKTPEEVQTLVERDGGKVHWTHSPFEARCPQCGKELRLE